MIVAYRKVVSPVLPSACRFHPTCSRYAADAIERHGSFRGVLLAAKRLARCHPWHPGGFDPVPDRVPGADTGYEESSAEARPPGSITERVPAR